jgi:peptide/nickel transport system permease protein
MGALPKSDLMALGGLVLIVMIAIIGPLLTVDPTLAVANAFDPPSVHHLLGVDEVGRDVFSRVLNGLRASLLSAVAVILSGVLIGGLIGLVAGSIGGLPDAILMRITDAFLAMPGPILALAVVAALGPSLPHTLIAVAVVWWPWYARLVRGEVRAWRSRPHIDAARLAGVSRVRLMTRHLLPGALPPVIVTASLDIQNLVLTLAGLSFLGLGAPSPAPELGAMAARGSEYLFGHPWIPIAPGVAVLLLATTANLAGDAIRDLFGRGHRAR